MGILVKRSAILRLALQAVGARHRHYGTPRANFDAIAARWRAHLRNRYGIDIPLDAQSIAVMMVDVKLARLENDPQHRDSWVDVAGYAACGGEIAGHK